jgi:hypothetical protein
MNEPDDFAEGLLHGGSKEVLLAVRKELGMGPPHQ